MQDVRRIIMYVTKGYDNFLQYIYENVRYMVCFLELYIGNEIHIFLTICFIHMQVFIVIICI